MIITPFMSSYLDPSLRWLGTGREQSACQKAAISRKIRQKAKSKRQKRRNKR